MNLLEIRNLRTHFPTPGGTARAVDGVDLVVAPGEAVGVVGESGSGKTVLALTILGLQPHGGRAVQKDGEIRLRGEDLLSASPKRLRAVRGGEIAMIFQEPMASLNPVFTVGNQVGEVLRLHGERGGDTRRVEALLAEVGLPDPHRLAESYPHQLSGGMRQRVMIAMALAGDPSLLIADEPTTALDVTVQAQILDLLGRLREERNLALLLISHDLHVVGRLCQRVCVMYGGRVVEEGAVEDVLSQPLHPYTRGLLGSRLSIHDRRKGLRPIPGSVPEAMAWPTGCRFHPRCPSAGKRCRAEEPDLVSMGSGPRNARCWFPDKEEG